MPNKLVKNDTKKEIDQRVSRLLTSYERSRVEKEGLEALEKVSSDKEEKMDLDGANPITKLMSLYEFDNSVLMSNGFSESYRTLATNMSLDIQQEYKCQTTSEKATAHLVAQNYVRTLEIQKNMYAVLQRDTYSDLTMKRYSILSKEYDRANRQYLMSLQTLQSIKQPPIRVSVKAQTANIANQQLIQENTNVKPK